MSLADWFEFWLWLSDVHWSGWVIFSAFMNASVHLIATRLNRRDELQLKKDLNVIHDVAFDLLRWINTNDKSFHSENARFNVWTEIVRVRNIYRFK